jgi:acyl-homoserine lactone synthase
MVLLITNRNAARHAALFDKIYRFRHRFFVDHMRWTDLRKPDGREIDQFDMPSAAHIVGLEQGEVVSYTRLLPTTGPHLMRDVFGSMLQGADEPTGPEIWEWTRCAVEPRLREGRKGADPYTARLFLSVAEACLHLGIKALLVQTHPLLLTRIIELGWHARPLALPSDWAGETVVPIYAGVDEATLAASREAFGIKHPVLDTETVPAGSAIPEPLNVA